MKGLHAALARKRVLALAQPSAPRTLEEVTESRRHRVRREAAKQLDAAQDNAEHAEIAARAHVRQGLSLGIDAGTPTHRDYWRASSLALVKAWRRLQIAADVARRVAS
jgi:hypothetical protein